MVKIVILSLTFQVNSSLRVDLDYSKTFYRKILLESHVFLFDFYDQL